MFFLGECFHERVWHLSRAFCASFEVITGFSFTLLWCIVLTDFHVMSRLHSRSRSHLVVASDSSTVLLNSVC